MVDVDTERGRVSLSTRQLEREPGDMLRDPLLVFDRAEETVSGAFKAYKRKQDLLKVLQQIRVCGHYYYVRSHQVTIDTYSCGARQ